MRLICHLLQLMLVVQSTLKPLWRRAEDGRDCVLIWLTAWLGHAKKLWKMPASSQSDIGHVVLVGGMTRMPSRCWEGQGDFWQGANGGASIQMKSWLMVLHSRWCAIWRREGCFAIGRDPVVPRYWNYGRCDDSSNRAQYYHSNQ